MSERDESDTLSRAGVVAWLREQADSASKAGDGYCERDEGMELLGREYAFRDAADHFGGEPPKPPHPDMPSGEELAARHLAALRVLGVGVSVGHAARSVVAAQCALCSGTGQAEVGYNFLGPCIRCEGEGVIDG